MWGSLEEQKRKEKKDPKKEGHKGFGGPCGGQLG